MNRNDRLNLTNLTVGELIETLKTFSPETKVYTNGCEQMYIHVDNMQGNICIDSDDLDDIYHNDEGEFTGNTNDYITCSTYGDYSPTAPWNAPGMKISDYLI